MRVADPEAAGDRFGFGNADSFAPSVYSPADLLVVLGVITFTSLAIGFPGQLTLTEVRSRRMSRKRKRSPLNDVVERVNDIYMSVVESEECMQRIACEVGGLAKDVGLKDNGVTKMADPFVPSKYKAYFKQFTKGQDCHKIKCGNMF